MALSLTAPKIEWRALWAKVRPQLPDLLGLAVAFLYGSPTISYAFGRDQAIFHYIGREWLEGRIPYRDSFDLKPPAIYLLHALSVLLFGPHVWAIRLIELLGVVSAGVLAGLAVRREGPRARGELGLCAMVSVTWYYSTLDFWDSGQAEIWQGWFLLAAYVSLLRIKSVLRGAYVGGLLAGVATMFKFTAGLGALLLVLPLVSRAYALAQEPRKRALEIARALLVYGAGGLTIIALFLGYYAYEGALPYLVELAAYIRYYTKSSWNPPNPGEMTRDYWTRSGMWLIAFFFAWLIAAYEAYRRRSYRVLAGAAMAMVLLMGTVVQVAVQKKFFNYHWGVVAPFLTLIASYGVAECARRSAVSAWLATSGFVLASFAMTPGWPTNWGNSYRLYTLGPFWEYVHDRIDYEQLMTVFIGNQNYNWPAQRAIAKAINERKQPGDLLHVRGFELGIYAMTSLHTPSRFVSEMPLDEPALEFNRPAWRKEHDDALWGARPRFFVGFFDRVEDDANILAHGYHEIARAGLFVLFERNE
ncbi:MAG TPA: hypothetical protein VFX59_18215 [Polyangiales bacterium]|nr:hypothetical protein [Polyangiales bacterium]